MDAIELRKISNINSDKAFGNVINKIERYILASAKEGLYGCNYKISSDDKSFVEKVVWHFSSDKYSCSYSKILNGYFLYLSW